MESSINTGNTTLMKSVRLDVVVFMENHETVEELVEFMSKFFCEMGEFRRVEFQVSSVLENVLVPLHDEEC